MTIRAAHFNKQTEFFHLTLTYKTSALLKILDWIFVQQVLRTEIKANKVEIQALVMMDTHLHLLIATDLKNEKAFSEKMQAALGAFENDSHLCEKIENFSQYLNVYKYIYRNPVEAGLCKNVQDYTYSSLHALLGRSHLTLPVYDQVGLIQDAPHKLNWLNNTEQNFKYSKLSWLKSDEFNPEM